VLTWNFADLWEAVVDRVSEREALVCGDRRFTYGQLEDRINRLAHVLSGAGVGPGDHVGCYLTNGPEYIETMFAAFKLRAVPININYRYVADELRHLFDDSEIVALVHDAEFGDRVVAASGDTPFKVALSVGDGGTYEAALAAADPSRPVVEGRSGEDRYLIYTGGTTGMPKGVTWRQEDAFFACIGGGDPMRLSGPVTEPAEVLDRIIDFDFVALPLAPLMHAAAQWTSISWWFAGARVVLLPGSFDAARVWRTLAEEKVSTVIIVGDAMARPLVDEWDASGPYDTSSLFALGSGGAPLSASLKDRLHEILPTSTVTDGFGSSETGAQGSQRLEPGSSSGGVTRFTRLGEGTTVLADDLTEVEPGSGVIGRVALSGRIPLGYHRQPEATAATFVEVGGRRWVVTGDAATVEPDGSITLLGRGSGSINTGGEKVFPEEVEGALKSHPNVYDAVVVGIPDERFGQRVAAVVSFRPGQSATLEELAAHCRTFIAGYKVPRDLTVVDEVVRSPTGKADYRWASATALAT